MSGCYTTRDGNTSPFSYCCENYLSFCYKTKTSEIKFLAFCQNKVVSEKIFAKVFSSQDYMVLGNNLANLRKYFACH